MTSIRRHDSIAPLARPGALPSPAEVLQQLQNATQGWAPKPVGAAARVEPATSPVQKPAVRWSGGVQHNGNNPEVIDQLGRSYSSRSVAPAGVPFTGAAGPRAQSIFSSNKNMTGKAVDESVVLSNPGATAMKVKVRLEVSDPPSARGQRSTELTIPAGGSVAVPVVKGVSDGGFTAFRATVDPVDAAAKGGRIHVDVVSHRGSAPAATLASAPVMPTEGERGYRVPPARLAENPAYIGEVRDVMRAAGGTRDPSTLSGAEVKAWVMEQQSKARKGEANAFDPSVNRGIQGRVNGLVSASEGDVSAQALRASAPGASTTVRVLPNATPPEMAVIDGKAARRPGTSTQDKGAYGKDICTTVPVTNPTDKPITVTIAVVSPPPRTDGSQAPGHQVYNGPVEVTADGKSFGKGGTVKVMQPASGAASPTRLATVTIPPGKTVNVGVTLQTHANSQFPVDVVVTRRR